MRDIHCHILPDVDDGARDLPESLCMLQAARQAGVTSLTCTPHCRQPYFDFDRMREAYDLLQQHAPDMSLRMGFEVNVSMLMHLGMDWADRLHFEGSSEFLLELEDNANEIDFRQYRRVIYELQCKGYDVIVAHPERYQAIQRRSELAHELVRMGCKLQASGDFLYGGRMPDPHTQGGLGLALVSRLSTRSRHVRACARKLFQEGLYAYIASDAHCAWHYEVFRRAYNAYAGLLAK